MEQLLFNAHVQTHNVGEALRLLASILRASRTSLWLSSVDGTLRFFLLRDGEVSEESLAPERAPFFTLLRERFARGETSFAAFGRERLTDALKSVPESVHSLVAVPVKDPVSAQFYGILTLCNLKRDGTQQAFLKALTFSFALFCRNFRNRELLRKEGERDGLTGLYNGSRYERKLPVIETQFKDALSCIYIDVNGLREINNFHGHEAGDRMLRAVAYVIRNAFDTPYLYRTGWDEFVIFVMGDSQSLLESKAQALFNALAAHDYHIACGIATGRELSSLSSLIREAEAKMYAMKKRFYVSQHLHT